MNVWVFGAALALCAVAAVVLVVHLVRDQPVEDGGYLLLAALEVVLLVQLVWGAIALSDTSRDVDGITFVSYLVSLVLVLPIGAFWSLAERTRSGTAVLLVAVATVAALEVRLQSLWSAGA